MQTIDANTVSSLLKFDNPPLTEVVYGVTFDNLDRLFAAHIGVLWGRFQPDFPKLDEGAPLASVIEIFDEQSANLETGYTNALPLPREMFVSRDETNVIQVQRDRFVYNWRKMHQGDLYPGYANLVKSFQDKFEIFQHFVQSANAIVQPRQYELSYVNQIPQGDLWNKLDDLNRIFPNINLSSIESSVMADLETASWRLSFVLPNKSGRLYATVQTDAFSGDNMKPIVLFDLTVRGMAGGHSSTDRQKWFDTAHDWIVKALTDLTTAEVQEKMWKKKQ